MPVDKAKCVQLYREGMTCREIADELDCSHGYVRKVLHDAGITMRPRGPRPGLGARGNHELHRKVAQEKLGRPLSPGETVHHVNGNKRDNRPENVFVFPDRSSHQRYHLYVMRWALERCQGPTGPMEPRQWLASSLSS